MRCSLYTRILLSCLATSLLALAGFLVVTMRFSSTVRENFFDGLHTYALAEAMKVYEAGGAAKLKTQLSTLDREFRAEHHLTDALGTDLVDGRRRTEYLNPVTGFLGFPKDVDGRALFMKASPDGRYRLIILAPPPIKIANFLSYYLLVLLAVAVICWLLAVGVATPIREMAQVVSRFGRGDLSARVALSRRDEIGGLARSFNEMAGRIETLLTAERRLLQDISHELRSPLARMSFALELLRDAPDPQTGIVRLRKELRRLSRLAAELVEVTRSEGDPGSHRLQETRLEKVVEDVAADCELEALARECRLTTYLPAGVTVLADVELLRRAVENVIRNAILYAPPRSAIDIRVCRTDYFATITVRDFGPGVPDNALDEIFKPFFRVDHSRNGATGGVGLGLAIASRAVGVHHGTVSARNADPGLSVTISLPLLTRLST